MLRRSSEEYSDLAGFPNKLRLHTVDGDCLYASGGNNVYKISATEEYSNLFCKLTLDLFFSFRNISKITRRCFRSGIHHIVCFQDKLVIFVDKFIVTLNAQNGAYSNMPLPYIGSRPLTICNAANERLYYGEYRGSRKSNSASIFSSNDGIQWAEVFRISNIRHIHGVFFDPYERSIWVTTGDADSESGLWVTYNEFVSLERIFGGSQQVRAIQLLFTRTHIYFGSDSPSEANHIYRLEKKSLKIERLCEVESPIYWGCKVGDYLFFSSGVEPTSINKTQDACIWGSPDGLKWKRIAKFRKDIWPKKLFQYGQILFPAGENLTNNLLFTPWATEYDQTLQCIDVRKLYWD